MRFLTLVFKMRKKEYCTKCEREYDGSYPCPCGCSEFKKIEDAKGDKSE